MATNLTPEQLAQLQRLFSTPVDSGGDGNAYMPENVYFNGRNYDKQDTGYLGYDLSPTDFSKAGNESAFNGQGYDQYGNDGSFTGSGQFTGIEDSNKAMDFIKAAAMMAPAFAAGISPAINGAMSFGTNPVMSGGSALSGAGTSAIGAGADLMNGLNGSDIMSDAFVANGGYGAGGFGGTSGSYMSNLLGGSGDLGSRIMGGTGAGSTTAGTAASTAASAAGKGSSLLGAGATLLGAAAGAEGQDASSSTTRDIPEWLKPYVTGQGGLLSQTQQQLNTSRSPERMAQWDQMRNTGLGLMNAPIAGNPTTGWTFGR